MVDNTWQTARLIPTSGIAGQDEAERRATSALLAVMSSVREFGAAIVRPLGAPAGALATYIEVPFVLEDRTVIPDGLLQTSRGGRAWTALVEVKTGGSELDRAQVEAYLDVAREQGFDAVLTISNQISPAAAVHPVDVDKRKLRKVALHHISWSELLTIAVQQRVHRGVSDPDQAWILGELIRYLEHPRSGALDFTDMGPSWVTVREAVAAGTLRANDKGLPDTVSRWEQLLRFTALRLGRELGADVQVVLTRREAADATVRSVAQTQSLVDRGVLTGSLRIPGTVAPIDISADLRAGRVTASIDIDAPREGRAVTRVNWLTRQLKDAPDVLRIDAWTLNARTSTSELLRTIRDDPGALIEDPGRELRTFRVAAISALGPKRSGGRGGFIDSVLAAVDGFYASVVQGLRPWAPKAPQLPRGGRIAAEDAGLTLSPPSGDIVEELGIDPPEPGDRSVDDALVTATLEAAAAPLREPAEETSASHIDDDDLIAWTGAEDRLERERDLESSVGGPTADQPEQTEARPENSGTRGEASTWTRTDNA